MNKATKKRFILRFYTRTVKIGGIFFSICKWFLFLLFLLHRLHLNEHCLIFNEIFELNKWAIVRERFFWQLCHKISKKWLHFFTKKKLYFAQWRSKHEYNVEKSVIVIFPTIHIRLSIIWLTAILISPFNSKWK